MKDGASQVQSARARFTHHANGATHHFGLPDGDYAQRVGPCSPAGIATGLAAFVDGGFATARPSCIAGDASSRNAAVQHQPTKTPRSAPSAVRLEQLGA